MGHDPRADPDVRAVRVRAQPGLDPVPAVPTGAGLRGCHQPGDPPGAGARRQRAAGSTADPDHPDRRLPAADLRDRDPAHRGGGPHRDAHATARSAAGRTAGSRRRRRTAARTDRRAQPHLRHAARPAGRATTAGRGPQRRDRRRRAAARAAGPSRPGRVGRTRARRADLAYRGERRGAARLGNGAGRGGPTDRPRPRGGRSAAFARHPHQEPALHPDPRARPDGLAHRAPPAAGPAVGADLRVRDGAPRAGGSPPRRAVRGRHDQPHHLALQPR